MTVLSAIDELIKRGGRFAPRWGWHDDHRVTDGTPAYLPALQQVRGETADLLKVLSRELNGGQTNLIPGRCLQLGMGECYASHYVWGRCFERFVTLDWGAFAIGSDITSPGLDVASPDAISAAASLAPYDFLLIDAGHSAEDARRDHANYGPLVRPGGIIAFHDALRRPGFEDAVQVWRYLETLDCQVNMIGTEVGVAWLRV